MNSIIEPAKQVFVLRKKAAVLDESAERIFKKKLTEIRKNGLIREKKRYLRQKTCNLQGFKNG